MAKGELANLLDVAVGYPKPELWEIGKRDPGYVTDKFSALDTPEKRAIAVAEILARPENIPQAGRPYDVFDKAHQRFINTQRFDLVDALNQAVGQVAQGGLSTAALQKHGYAAGEATLLLQTAKERAKIYERHFASGENPEFANIPVLRRAYDNGMALYNQAYDFARNPFDPFSGLPGTIEYLAQRNDAVIPGLNESNLDSAVRSIISRSAVVGRGTNVGLQFGMAVNIIQEFAPDYADALKNSVAKVIAHDRDAVRAHPPELKIASDAISPRTVVISSDNPGMGGVSLYSGTNPSNIDTPVGNLYRYNEGFQIRQTQTAPATFFRVQIKPHSENEVMSLGDIFRDQQELEDTIKRVTGRAATLTQQANRGSAAALSDNAAMKAALGQVKDMPLNGITLSSGHIDEGTNVVANVAASLTADTTGKPNANPANKVR